MLINMDTILFYDNISETHHMKRPPVPITVRVKLNALATVHPLASLVNAERRAAICMRKLLLCRRARQHGRESIKDSQGRRPISTYLADRGHVRMACTVKRFPFHRT